MYNKRDKLFEYCEDHTSAQSSVLYKLERETYLKTLAPQMMCSQFQGRLFSMISKLVKPKAVLEIGTFTGYAAICFAEGLAENGLVHTIEVNEELEQIIRKYIHLAGFDTKIKLYIDDAKKIIPSMDETFDIVFIDAGKNDYDFFYELVLPKVRTGGLILADNVLWSGKIVSQKQDKDTQVIHAFNQKIQKDNRVENLLLPVRDGLMIARKLKSPNGE